MRNLIPILIIIVILVIGWKLLKAVFWLGIMLAIVFVGFKILQSAGFLDDDSDGKEKDGKETKEGNSPKASNEMDIDIEIK